MQERLNRSIEQACQTLQNLGPLAEPLERAATALGDCLTAGGKLLACGNGGSAADAGHLTTEFVCRLCEDRPPFPAICLNAHGGDLTAIGNDYSFEQLFERQVKAFGNRGDVLIVVSSSGNSENIHRALVAGRDRGLTTISLLGRDGGRCAGLADIELIVPADDTARIQEAQKFLIHTLCEAVEPRLQG